MPRSGRRSIRRGRSAVAAALLVPLVGGAVVIVSTVTVTAAHAAAPGTKVLNYAASLTTTNQGMWGPGSTPAPSDQTTTIFDQGWNESGGVDEETSVSFDPCFGIAGGCTIDFGTYGGKLTASTSGQLGMAASMHGISGGTVGVNYPLSFGITGPADDSFAPGDTVTVSTTAPQVSSGASITSVYPDFTSVSLDGTFGFHASASGEICASSCASGSIFDVNLPSGSATSVSGPILSINKSDLLLIQGLGLAQCFGIAEGVLFGAATFPNDGNFCENTVSHQDNGYLAFPDVKLGATTVGADKGLAASGSQQYMVLPISAVAWAAKIASLPFGFPNLSGSFNGVGVNYTTVNDILTAVVSQHQDYTFKPTVNLTLDFGQSVPYVVKDAANVTVFSATASTATFPLGDSIHLTPTTALTVVPTVRMGSNTITNHTFDTVTGTNQVQALAVSAAFGSCCDGAFPGITLNLGPLYDSGPIDIGSSDIERTNGSWQLAGFNAPQLAPFTITPDPVPVPTGKTVTPVEGASFTGLVASFHDPDPTAAAVAAAEDTTAVIDWGDGHTSVGTITGTGASFDVSGTHTYAEEGPYSVAVTVTDTDTPTVHATAASHADVSDAALTVTASPALHTVEGAPSTTGTVVARFVDADPAGTASDYTASIDWGDGTAANAATVSDGTGGEFVVSAPSHTYAEEGTPTVTVTITDEGGAQTVAHPAMTTVDAALHSAGLTNGTVSGTTTPVLYWPGTGNAVLAHVTDDDPLGTSSDYTAVVHWGDGTQSSAVITAAPGGGFNVTGNHTYANADLGLRQVVIDVTDEGGSTTQATTTVLAYGSSAGGTFAIGDKTLTALAPNYSKAVTFWTSSWNKVNALSGGAAPSSFKGFVNHPPATPLPPATVPSGTAWTTDTGASSPPPVSVPAYMLVLVTGKITQSSSTVASGSVVHWVIVRTNTGYGPTAGQTGTGTVVAVLN